MIEKTFPIVVRYHIESSSINITASCLNIEDALDYLEKHGIVEEYSQHRQKVRKWLNVL